MIIYYCGAEKKNKIELIFNLKLLFIKHRFNFAIYFMQIFTNVHFAFGE